jgi:serine/threonine protein kinase
MGSGASSHLQNSQEGGSSDDLKKKELMERYAVDYLLGRGGYSVIFHGIEKLTKKEIAMKRMKLENGDLVKVNSVFAELDAFKRIQSHDFIVSLHSAFYQSGCCYFVMDCLSGGDLRHFLRTKHFLDEQSVVYILACIGSALHHLHSRGVIHRDVKPENIGLDLRGRPYLADFGISMVSSEDNPLPLCQSSSGTLAYLAPEVLCPGNCHSYQSDFWSLGVMGYELLFSHRPFPRHCSFESLNFVRNEYGWMWDFLRSNPSPEPVDFDALRPPIDWIPPFPDPLLRLNEDGTPPDSVTVLIPSHRCSAGPSSEPILVSEELESLLQGLMDVRIPSRLGSMSRYSEFSDHECFVLNGCFPFSHLWRMESPLSGFDFETHGPSIQISSSFSPYDLEEDQGDSISLLDSFPKEIKQKLLTLSFENKIPAETNSNHRRELLHDAITPLTSPTPRHTPRKSRYDCGETVSMSAKVSAR